MKKRIGVFVFIASFLFVLCGCFSMPYEDVPVELTSGVYRIWNLTNKFRQSKEAYYINEDNKTTTSVVGKLCYLKLNEDLCKVAAVRAREIAQSFSHTRPNGKRGYTVAREMHIDYMILGENLAAGNEEPDKTFLQWKEDGLSYDLQGHRRNMLREEYDQIGIAYYYDPNSKYKHFWVMILAKLR